LIFEIQSVIVLHVKRSPLNYKERTFESRTCNALILIAFTPYDLQSVPALTFNEFTLIAIAEFHEY
jgi:hypothetical protein